MLGMGNIGALAAKPVMEGKVVLLKELGDLDGLDVEIDTTDPDEFVKTAALLEGSFGAINLEDIRAPDCFYIESKLQEKVNIPVLHNDQHGTAIIVLAALMNACEL